MERRIMKQGPSTLVVSLPSSWVKKFHVKKSKVIHVEERGRALLVSLDPQMSDSEIILNVSGTMPMTNRITGALYKAGFDNITLKYSTSKEAEEILRAVPSLLGHQVISHENSTIVLRKMLREDVETFDISYRKCFHILNDMFRDAVKGLETDDLELLRGVVVKDVTFGIFCDYTRRMLISNRAGEFVPEKYIIAVQLEKIGDRLKHVALCCSEEKKFSSNSMLLLKQISKFFYQFHDVYYDFSLEKIASWGRSREELKKLCTSILQKSSKSETVILHECASILSLIWELNEPLMIMNLKR